MTDPNEDEFVASVTEEVLECLRRKRFFEKLDELFCPTDGSQGARCEGNFRTSESVLQSSGFTAEDIGDILGVLKSRGGFCDCEVLYNVAETCRLKANYWRGQAQHLAGSNDRDKD